jgi:hypothetical protein
MWFGELEAGGWLPHFSDDPKILRCVQVSVPKALTLGRHSAGLEHSDPARASPPRVLDGAHRVIRGERDVLNALEHACPDRMSLHIGLASRFVPPTWLAAEAISEHVAA